MIRFAIEIKTINGLEQSVESCMLEAQLQLIGLNAFNTSNSPPFITNNSPPVVLTNLAKSHCVLYWAHKDDGWGYLYTLLYYSIFYSSAKLFGRYVETLDGCGYQQCMFSVTDEEPAPHSTASSYQGIILLASLLGALAVSLIV
eukprot:scaffold15309_cov198-Amphora_coffeaeformis.AAC.4